MKILTRCKTISKDWVSKWLVLSFPYLEETYGRLKSILSISSNSRLSVLPSKASIIGYSPFLHLSLSLSLLKTSRPFKRCHITILHPGTQIQHSSSSFPFTFVGAAGTPAPLSQHNNLVPSSRFWPFPRFCQVENTQRWFPSSFLLGRGGRP